MEHSPGFLKLVNESKTRVRQCDIHDVKRRLEARENFALLDCREESEFAAGHLPVRVVRIEHVPAGRDR